MDLLVVGAGQMGRWFGATGPWTPTFVDLDPAVATAAAEAVAGADANPPAEARFDVVCIAVPMSAAEDAIATHAERASRAIVDVTGEMATATAAMATHAPELERASFHPLFAASNAPGSVAIVVDNDGPTVQRMRSALEIAGNTIVETTPAEHDRAMETIQAAAHTAVLAYGLAAADIPEDFATPISRTLEDLVEQVTSGDPAVYAEIQQQFAGADRVAAAAAQIADADPDTFVELYEAAGSIHE